MTDALKRYQELTANGAEPASPVERLRAFCSLAMGGQDWLDVEPFFDAILAHVDAQAAENERLTAALQHEADCVEAAKEEIERLTAALHAQPGPVSMDDVEWAGKAHLHDAQQEIERLRAAAQHEADCAEAAKAEVEALRAERDALKAESESLREMLAHLYAGPDLYSDDGELQDARAVPFIDFKRDTAADIRCAMVERKERKEQR